MKGARGMNYFRENPSLPVETGINELSLDAEFSYGAGLFFNRDVKNTSHWSVPWADLMMTMFILFAVLYAYHAISEEKEVPSKRSEIDFHEEVKPAETGDLSRFYETSMETIRVERLQDITSVELIKEKAVKIILPSDVLFDVGEAELKSGAVGSLEAVGRLIKDTNYSVTVAGHTDEIPIHTDRFPSNWELSTARACVAAKFLIEKTNISPGQIQVIGYAEYRPIGSNETSAGRSANRRVEVIISKDNIPDTLISL